MTGAAPGDSAPCRISVVICVYTERRWDDIMAAVGSVAGQSQPAHEILVVVDHNPALLQRLLAEYPPAGPGARVLPNREPRGLSGGRNTGVAVATGDVVAFLDDDAVADPGWLKFIADSYARPGVTGVGGRTLPNWVTRRPGWMPHEFDWVVGCNYAGMPEPGQPVRNLIGGNATFRREVFDLAGGFRSGIGRSRGRLPLGCEETEFCIRLRQKMPGITLLIDDRATVRHKVPAARCRFSYFLTRCYAEGLSKALVTRSVGAADGLAAERRYVLRALPAGIARNLAAPIRGDAAGAGRAAAILAGLTATAAGYAVGSLTGRGR